MTTCKRLLHRSALLTLSALSMPAFADSLFTMPVAGTLQPRRLTTYLSGGTGARLDSESTAIFAAVDYNLTRYFSAGLTTRLTDGVSARPEGSLQFAPVGQPYAFSAGFGNVGVRSFRSQPYVVGSTHFGGLGVYVGGTHDSYGTHPMLGLNYLVHGPFSVQADWINDDGSFLTLGGRWQALRDLAVAAGFSHANADGDSSGGNGVFASVQKDFRL